MKKLIIFCCSSIDTEEALPPHFEWRSKKCSNSSPEQALGSSNKQIIITTKCQNSLNISEARFLPDGDFHNIIISFHGEGETKLMFTIDGKMVYQVETRRRHQGKFEIHMSDGTVVDCFWDVFDNPYFLFYTREYYSSSTRNGCISICGKSNDYYHVHSLEILERKEKS